ncbi:MAG: D-alanyl-D-alanine dipeptidase [Holosporales bacterium]
MTLIHITAADNVLLDLRYATANNFTQKKVYEKPICYLHKDAYEKLKIAIEIAASLGLGLKIFDAFRPQFAQQKLWDHTPDPTFITDPQKGSHHTRGVAIDLTLVNFSGKELDMGTPFDDFTPQSFHGNLDIAPYALQNRLTLLGIMSTAGFDFYKNEWWHYQLFNPRTYDLILDAPEVDAMR